MFLIRSVFWLTAVVMVLPASQSDGEPPPRVGLLEAATAARTIAHDLTSVCARHPAACETSWNAVDLFWRKIETGIAIFNPDDPDENTADPIDPDRIGSLLEDDLMPAWSVDGALPPDLTEYTGEPGT